MHHVARNASSLLNLRVRRAPWPWALGLACVCTAVSAAPLTSPTEAGGDGLEAGRARAAAQGLDEPRITESQAQSKTIKMLLEMQHAPAPLEGTGQSKRELAAQVRAAKAADLPAVPISTETTPVLDWRSGLPGRSVAGNQVSEESPASQTPRPGAPVRQNAQPVADEPGLRDVLPREWINYLRENRQWVLGAGVGLLALGWLAASLFSRRR